MIFQYTTKKIGLKPLDRSDILRSNYMEWFYDPQVTVHNSHGAFPMTKEKVDEFFQSIGKDKIVFAIYALRTPDCWDLSDEEMKKIERHCFHIGNVSLQRIDLMNRSAEFAILIGEPDYYNHGVATEVTKMILWHAFMKVGLNKVWAGTSCYNFGMRKLFKNLGFTQEGRARDAMIWNGVFIDVFNYSILKGEWEHEQRGKNNKSDSGDQSKEQRAVDGNS